MDQDRSPESKTRRIGDTAELDARGITSLRVLNCIRGAGEASRTDIAAALSLSPATVTSVTSGLMSGSLIEEVASQEMGEPTRRGRPRVALRLTKGLHHVAGIKIARKSVSAQILDFDGTVVAKGEFPLARFQMDPADLVATVSASVAETCRDIFGGIGALAGISIGLAGQVNANTRFVHWSSSLTRRNVDLGSLLDAELPCPSFVENDANLVAKAEHLFGEARGLTNFLVVTVEYGLGLGIVLEGKLHRGERGCGAEFGHTKIMLDGAMCQCGQAGCLEAYIGSYALRRDAAGFLDNTETATALDVIQAATDGNQEAQAILDRAGRVFALGLANLINLFDPEMVILSGAPDRIAHLHTDAVLAQIGENVLSIDAPQPAIRVHPWGDEMWARGAAALGIEKVSALKVRELGRDAA
ncbi:MAG: ROK family transcriptional regulator [Pseudomonadota bacterium]